MSTTWFPEEPDGRSWSICVDNPGYAEVDIDAPYQILDRDWHRTFNGPEIGQLLVAVTRCALGGESPRDIPFLQEGSARKILPALQQAVVLAVGGTDRHERTFVDEEEPPQRPLCSRCNEGTWFTPGAMPSEYCDKYGHQPYGYGSGTRWTSAQATYEQVRARWERAHA